MEASVCDTCNEPVHFNKKLKQWVHDKPLAELKVSAVEATAVLDAAAHRRQRALELGIREFPRYPIPGEHIHEARA